MAGGDEVDFERARPVMSRLTANYTLMGLSGAGQATKLVNQVLCAIQFQAVAEAVALAERAGVSAERIPAALAGGRADSRILQEFGAKMARRDYAQTGRLDNMLKDLDGVQALARSTNTPLPATAIVAEIHRALVGAEAEDASHRYPMVLEIAYPDRAAIEEALASPVRAESREVTQGLLNSSQGGFSTSSTSLKTTFPPTTFASIGAAGFRRAWSRARERNR